MVVNRKLNFEVHRMVKLIIELITTLPDQSFWNIVQVNMQLHDFENLLL